MEKSAQILFAEDQLLRAGRRYGEARYAETHNDKQSEIVVGRYLTCSAELVRAAEGLWRAEEDTRNRKTLAGLSELRDNAPAFEGEAP